LPNAYNGSDSKSAELFQNVLNGLIEDGVMKIFMGEGHTLANNNMYANTLLGALASRKPVTWFIESCSEKDLKSGKFLWADKMRTAMRKQNERNLVETDVLQYFDDLLKRIHSTQNYNHDQQPLVSLFPAFRQRIANASICMDLMNFFDEDAKDLTRFINFAHLAIAKVGLSHAVFQAVRPNEYFVPWSPENLMKVNSYEKTRPTLSSQQEMMNGFSRALERSPAVLVTTKKLLNSIPGGGNQRLAFENYYVSNGFSVLEVIFPSLNDSLHIISTCAVRPSITKVIAGSNDSHLFNFKHRCESSKSKEDL
jgi:hypothetical protein